MTKGKHKIPVIVAEQVTINSTIDIHRTDTVTAYHQRNTHNRAYTVRHDTLLPLQVIIDHGIISNHRLSFSHHTFDRAATDLVLESALVNSALLLITCNREFKLVAGGIYQHKKATLGLNHINHFIHHQAQHLIKFKRRIENT